MRAARLALLALIPVVLVACTSITPQSTPFVSTPITPLPGSSLLPSAGLPTLPVGSLPAVSSPSAEPPTIAPETASPTPEPTSTPKPTKKPTPTPSPTPAKTPGDIEVAFQDTTIPNPFYNNTDYTITVYISALGTQDLPNVHAKLVVQNEGVSYKFDTGPIAYGDTYTHDIVVNVPAIGPSALILSATMPDGYVDTKRSNNTTTVDIDVMLNTGP